MKNNLKPRQVVKDAFKRDGVRKEKRNKEVKIQPNGFIENFYKVIKPTYKEKIEYRDDYKYKIALVISIKDRADYFRRALEYYRHQTIGMENVQFVVMDIMSKDDIRGLCKEYNQKYNYNFHYVKLDESKGAIPQEGFTPALSNNIGFKLADAPVVAVIGPETLLSPKSLAYSVDLLNTNKLTAIYATVYRSDKNFVNGLTGNWHEESFDILLNRVGAKNEIMPQDGYWWYYMATRKENLIAMRGVDENYMRGICAEDDDLARRLHLLGCKLIYPYGIKCIHQDHSSDDKNNESHSFRFNNKRKWNEMRQKNLNLLKVCEFRLDAVANYNIEWGKMDAIVEEEKYD
jgi:cellulose synthase/poly-beta-1,6-N-acetylglucosamine synthase-like glycosyltransferase